MRGSFNYVPVQNNLDTVIAGHNHRRQAIEIGNPTADNVFLAFGQPATVNGLLIPPNTKPHRFHHWWHGDLVKQDLHALCTVAAVTLPVIVVED